MNRGPNIFDFLTENQIPYFVSDPLIPEDANRDELIRRIDEQELDFAFMYWAGLDGLLHQVGNQSPEVPARLRMYEEWIETILEHARKNYEEIRLYVFSDHGMANCDVHIDLRAKIDTLPVTMAKDYAVVYDSTMARFWFFNEDARREITACLETVPEGRIVPEAELKEMRAYFDDHYFGELIFLVKEGVLIVPSHMGERPITAMHGYHPTDKHSYASLLSNSDGVPEEVTAIPHLFNLMTKDATEAKERNH